MYSPEDLINEDELLGPCVDEGIVKSAEKWLYFFASKLGVKEEDVQKSFPVFSLFKAYAFRDVCIKKSYSTAGNMWNGSEQGDYYARKLAYYNNEIKRLEQQLTESDLAGISNSDSDTNGYKNYRTIEIRRG